MIAVEGSANGDGLASRVAHTRSGVKDTNAGVWGFADDGIAIGSDAPDDTPSLFVPRDRPLVFLPLLEAKTRGTRASVSITPVITCYYYDVEQSCVSSMGSARSPGTLREPAGTAARYAATSPRASSM